MVVTGIPVVSCMKLPDFFQSIFKRTAKTHEVYVSLYLDALQVAGSFFSIEPDGKVVILASRSENLKQDSWEERGVVVDEILGMLEEKTGHTDVTKTILGLPPMYLTSTGEIQKDVRVHIKQFMSELELQAIGFVPLQQAIIYKMRGDEGVPPSVILLGMNKQSIEVGVYKVGELSGMRQLERHEQVVENVEQALKSFTDIEVLPARILLYGENQEVLEDIKATLMKHQWTSKVNFLHFPKIETISDARIVESISVAGASELGATMTDVEHEEEATTETEELAAETVVPPSPTISQNPAVEPKEQESLTSVSDASEHLTTQEPAPVVDSEDTHVAIADVTPVESSESLEEHITEEVEDAQEVISEDFSIDSVTAADDNVVMVDAESLGFKKDVDVRDNGKTVERAVPQHKDDGTEEEEFDEEDDEEAEEERGGIKMPSFGAIRNSPVFSALGGIFGNNGGQKPIGLMVVGLVVLFSLLGALYWFLPHATVKILELPKSFETTQTITIDPNATVVDAEHGIIPGKKRDKAETGEKTVPVNGKKNVGDPAKGTVTIYNKATSSKTFKKGSVIVSGALQFTLDEDVQIASASENIGSLTFGKGDVRVTAQAIGPQSNLPSGAEFTFKDISSSTAIARNDKAFAGGTSREVTVVSRADYDAFVKTLSAELIEKAKQDFAQVVSGSEKIIDDTIKTTVTEKVFNQEIDQEAKQLDGKLTVTMSGIAYTDADVRALLTSASTAQIPAGYTVNDAKTTITVSGIQVKKDGKITGKASMKALALPVLDSNKIQSDITGKSLKYVENYLKGLPGVGGVEIGFTYSPTKSSLPANKKNISIIVSSME